MLSSYLQKCKKDSNRQKYTRRFLALFEKEQPTKFKSGSCKNPFLQCVCVCYWFFILHDNWKTLISMKNCIYKGRIQFRFQMVQKGQNNARTYTFQAKYFYQHFQVYSIFMCNECLSIKSYQFFKVWKRFNKEREKNTYAAVDQKRKTEKGWALFYNSLFYKNI